MPALATFTALAVPAPFDEAVLLLVAPILYIFYREPLRSAWRDAHAERVRQTFHQARPEDD